MSCLAAAGVLWSPSPAVAQQLTWVSTPTGGGPANGGAHGILSADGRFVAFDAGGVYVRDLQAATSSLVSVGTNGEPAAGALLHAINADGRFILFSTSSALTSEDTNDPQCPRFIGEGLTQLFPCTDLYLRDRQTNQTTLVSRSLAGAGTGDVIYGSMSDDGRFVLFLRYSLNVSVFPYQDTRDAFLLDRSTNTTTKLEFPQVSGDNAQRLQGAMISGDGSTIVYVQSYFDPAATTVFCPGASSCDIAKAMDRATGVTRSIQLPMTPDSVQNLTIFGVSTDGRYVLLFRTLLGGSSPDPGIGFSLPLYDFQQARIVASQPLPDGFPGGGPSASLRRDGQGFFYVIGRDMALGDDQVLYYDVQTRQITTVFRVSAPPPAPAFSFPTFRDVYAVSSSADGSRLAIDVRGDLGFPVSKDATHVYTFTPDSDGDGLFDAWETAFGLNPADPTDAAADPDHDGLTNLQEYQRGSHPTSHFTRYFAEGSSNQAFTTQLALLNPGSTPAAVVIRYLGPDGTSLPSQLRILAPLSRQTIGNRELPLRPTSDFSTVIESDVPVVAERTSGAWGAVGHGQQGETAIVQPSKTWFFAEGATGGPFSLFYELQNPGDAPAQVNVTYLLPAPQVPLTKTYTVAAQSRRTIFVDEEDPRLASNDVSASLTSDQPIVAERSLYLASLGQPLGGVAGGAGVTAPAIRWFMAEGATGPFFDLYVLLANPNPSTADVTLTYLLPDGTHFAKSYPVTGQSRLTILVDQEDSRLANTPVSIVAESMNNVPIVAERAMWWPEGQWYEGHSSVGSTVTSRKWALAEGEAGEYPVVKTFIMIANVSNVAGTATVTLAVEGSQTPKTVQLSLPANSRTTLPLTLSDFESLLNVRFGAIVTSPDVDLVVEHAIYRDIHGFSGIVIWGAGTAALGEPIP